MGSTATDGLPSVLPSHPEMMKAPCNVRPSAAFVAHLIATAQNVPQTRARRRGTADQAAARYAASAPHDAPHALVQYLL